MWNICRAPCLHSASDKISEYSKNIPWNQKQSKNRTEHNCIKQFDEKKIMVVDSQPYNTVVSRVVNIDSKPIESVVGRRKIIPDFVLVNNIENNDLVFTSRHNSADTHTNIGQQNMDSTDKTHSETEYGQSYTWNKHDYNRSHPFDPLKQSEYRSHFLWPKQSLSKDVVPKDIEPQIVAERVVPGKVVPIHASSTKKSLTIQNIAEVADKPDTKADTKSTKEVAATAKNFKSEYESEFRPFSSYVYVSGNGFLQKQNLHKYDEVDKAKNWYSEVEERTKQANQYKTRSQLGHPLASEGLTQIYSQGSIWNNYHRDRNLQALALATTQKIIEEKKQERVYYANHKPTPIRQLNSAPPSVRTGWNASSNADTPGTGSQASVRTKSPHVVNKMSVTDRPRSADKHSKSSAITDTPKPEGKIWLKPKPKTQETTEENKSVSTRLPANSGHKTEPKTPTDNNGEGGPKSPRPTSLVSSGNGKNGAHKEKPPIPSGPIRTTQIKSPEEITGVKSPSPESWTVPIDRGLNWVNGETPRNVDTKYSADMTAIKSAPVSDKSKRSDPSLTSANRSKLSSSKPMSVSTHSKPTATVQPSPSASLSSISNPGSKRVQSIEEEVKFVKPTSPRQKAGNVLDRAKHRLDRLWSRNK